MMDAIIWRPCAALLAILLVATPTHAADQSNLESNGWHVIAKTIVSGAFRGCDYDLPVPLDGGYTFVCREYNYHYAYRPEFVVMELEGVQKYLIDDEEFQGEIYKETSTTTHVVGDFRGCEFGKIIPLENGMRFKCRMYHYHYAYHPEVIIFQSNVTIDGEKYQGELSGQSGVEAEPRALAESNQTKAAEAQRHLELYKAGNFEAIDPTAIGWTITTAILCGIRTTALMDAIRVKMARARREDIDNFYFALNYGMGLRSNPSFPLSPDSCAGLDRVVRGLERRTRPSSG